MYIVTAAPSVLASAVGGHVGNWLGRWQVVCLGLVLQGGFYALGPKAGRMQHGRNWGGFDLTFV